MSAFVLALAVAAFASAPHTASASAADLSSTPFPRITAWWGTARPLAEDARRDYYVPCDNDPLHPDVARIASLRALNPKIALLANSNADALIYSPTNDRAVDAELVGAIPTSWLLTQVGSVLSASVTSTSSKTIPVSDTSKFRVNDLVVIDDEKCVVTGIVTGSLSVNRGYAGSVAAIHAKGARVAAVASEWPGTVTLDMTSQCPLGRAGGTFATPGTGGERASDWLARRTAGLVAIADWDGVFIDVCNGDHAQAFRGTTSFRTIASRTAPTTEADYAAFDVAWQAGVQGFLGKVRSILGDQAIIMTNAAPPAFSAANGTAFEGFPNGTTTTAKWHQTVFGPTPAYAGAYLDWSASAKAPNVTTLMTYGTLTDYRLMRFGLCTTLMGDGYYAYEASDSDHGSSGRWYDEYDNAGAGKGFLGSPLGQMYSAVPTSTAPDLLGGRGALSTAAGLSAWALYPRLTYAAAKSLDGTSTKITVSKSGGAINGVTFSLPGVPVTAATAYTLSFRARADSPLPLQALVQQTRSPYTTYMATDEIALGTGWRTYEIPLTSSGTDTAAQFILTLGKAVGTVWLADVKLQAGDRNVYRRDFQGGVALVNASDATATVGLNGVYRKIKGTQAPLVNDGSLVTSVVLPPKDGLVLILPAPTGTLTLAGGATRVDSATITCASAVTGAADMRIDAGAGTFAQWAPYSASTTITLAPGYGAKTVRVEYRNRSGATQLSATVDVMPPSPVVTTVSGIPDGWVNHDVSITFAAACETSAAGSFSIYCSLDADAPVVYSAPLTVTDEGTTTISYFSASTSGELEATRSALVRIDRTAPGLSLDATPAYVGSATVSANASDALSGLQSVAMQLDGGPWMNGSSITTNSPGAHTVTARALDAAGNERDESATFTVVPVTPVTTLTHVAGPASVRVMKPLRLGGSVLPLTASGRVTITKWRLFRKKWRRIGAANVSVVNGRFAYTFKPSTRGKWRFVAVYSGGAVGVTLYTSSSSGVKLAIVK